VPETPQTLRDLRVFVEGAAAAIMSDDASARVRSARRQGSRRRRLCR